MPLFCLLLGACTAPTEHVSESTVAPALSEIGAPETRFLTRDALYDKLKGAWRVRWPASCSRQAGILVSGYDDARRSSRGLFGAEHQRRVLAGRFICRNTYVEQMRKTGYNSTLKQMADAFKDSAYPLDHANKIGRENLQNGIEAPDSGSYLYNLHCDDLDWQINADFVGQLYPARRTKRRRAPSSWGTSPITATAYTAAFLSRL